MDPASGAFWLDVVARFGAPVAFSGLMFWFMSTQMNKIVDHLISADNRRAAQLDAFVGIQEKQAVNERVQADAMITSSKALAKVEETIRQIAGDGCGLKPKGTP